MRNLIGVSVIACTLASGGCQSRETVAGTPEPSVARLVDGEIGVARVAGGIRVTNGTDRGLAYVVRNSGWLGLVALCIDPGSSCVRLSARSSIVVPDTEILGYARDAREAQVTLWHVEPDGAGGHRAVIVKDVAIRL